MDDGRLFSAGVIGGVAFSVLSAFLRATGIPIDLELWLGTIVLAPGPAAWLVGFLWHIALSGFIAALYGRAFVALGRAGAASGLRVSVMHLSVSGALLGLLPLCHPRIPDLVPAPGAFLSAFGVTGVTAFVVVHLVYGALVGTLADAVGSRMGVERRSRVFHTSLPPRSSRAAAAH